MAGLIPLDAPDWTGALCTGCDPDLFFPTRGEQTKQAKAVCFRCPLRERCLDYALDNFEKHGIWGGMSEQERRVEWRRRRQAPALRAVPS